MAISNLKISGPPRRPFCSRHSNPANCFGWLEKLNHHLGGSAGSETKFNSGQHNRAWPATFSCLKPLSGAASAQPMIGLAGNLGTGVDNNIIIIFYSFLMDCLLLPTWTAAAPTAATVALIELAVCLASILCRSGAAR